jgi:hypothetical protein
MNFGQLVALLFCAREYTHRKHLSIRGEGSYAIHEALGEFYDELVPVIDSLTEMYQGRNHCIVTIPSLPVPPSSLDACKALCVFSSLIDDNRYKAIPEDETALHSELDLIVGLFASTIYKLENLK